MINKSLLNAAKQVANGMEISEDKFNEMVSAQEAKVQTNGATDPMSTQNTGFGGEYSNVVEYQDEMYSMITRDSRILPMLKGNHGEKNGQTVEVTIKGEIDLFVTGAEKVASAPFYGNLQSNNAQKTGRLPITIKEFTTSVELTKFNIQTSVDKNIVQTIQNEIVQSAARTVDAFAINADPTTDETPVGDANINFFDTDASGTLPANAYYLGGNFGVRYRGIENGVIGGTRAFDRSVYKDMLVELGEYAGEPTELMWIMSAPVGVKARFLPEYSTIDKVGAQASNIKGGYQEFAEGIEIVKNRDMPTFVGESGKVEIEGGNIKNTQLNTFSLVYKNAIQFAYGTLPMQIVAHERSSGWIFEVSFWFGLNVANNLAGLGKTVATAVVQA